ncbi:MAG TPA: LysR family transcriptional regulator [Cellvibrionaceae bacterium]|nr:LysR family transcriptional regulator [Cellvibrionaceae bacterium]HMY40279.1 LysR family transcriptional regulator [Marinagarivorans sp.]HNG61606.1 LysR family transcriptional regulator [Cellvibrionaceae bacterium]
MEIYQIRYFLAVSETLNFTRAAERCYVSQPALTKSIQKLEELLGGRLFDRTKNSVQLTELGRAMLPNFQQIYAAAQNTKEQARRLLREQRAIVRVGIMCSLDFNRLLPVIADFQVQHPQVLVQMREGTMEMLSEWLDKNDLDLALMSSPYDFPKRFDAHALFAEDYVVAYAPGHKYAQKCQLTLADLHQEPYCSRLNCEYADYIDNTLDQGGIDLIVVQESPREDWIASMVRAGLGVAFMPQSLAELAHLPFIKVADAHFRRRVQALTLAERPAAPSTQALINQLANWPWL